MSQITVVTNASYPICLDNGRHLHPGEIAEIEDSERHQHLIEQGHLRLAGNQPKAVPPTAAPVKSSEPARPQEVQA